MPALANHKHELFVLALAKGRSADQAYEDAGFKRHRGNAARLRADERVQMRLDEIQQRAVEIAEITRADVIRMLMEDRLEAKKNGQLSAAVRAAELLGKEVGMFVERRINANLDLEALPDSQRRMAIAWLTGQLADLEQNDG